MGDAIDGPEARERSPARGLISLAKVGIDTSLGNRGPSQELRDAIGHDRKRSLDVNGRGQTIALAENATRDVVLCGHRQWPCNTGAGPLQGVKPDSRQNS